MSKAKYPNIHEPVKTIIETIGENMDQVYGMWLYINLREHKEGVVTLLRYALDKDGNKYLNKAKDDVEILPPKQYLATSLKRGDVDGRNDD